MLFDHAALIGVDVHLATVHHRLGEAAAGSAGRVHIVGDPGIGKSRLLAAIGDRAVGEGWTVHRMFGVPADALQPLGVLDRSLGLALATPERPIGASVLGGNVAEGRFRDESRLVDVVDQLTAAAPLLLALDDVDLVDDATTRLLDRLVELLADRPLLVVSTRAAPPDHDGLGARSTVIQLEPLTASETDELVTSVLGRRLTELDPDDRAAVDRAAGVPLLVLAALAVAGEARAHRRSPVAALIDRLPDRTVDLLQTLAILGRSMELEELLALRDDDPLAVHRALEAAAADGLLAVDDERATIRWAVVVEELVARVPLPVRRSLHGRFAALLAERRAAAARIAHHAVHGSGTTKHEAVALLLDGGREVGSRSPTLALELLRQAIDVAEPDEPLRVDVLTEMVAALGWTGAFDQCEQTALAVLAQPIGDTRRAAMRRALALCSFLQNRATAAAEECERSADESTDRSVRARALGEAALARMAAADLDAAHIRAVEAVEAGELTGEPVSRCVGWSVRSRLRAFELALDESLDFAERAIAVAGTDPTREASLYHPGFFRLLTLVDLDRLDDSAIELERERTIGDRAGLAWTQPLHHGLAAVIHLFAGRLDAAETAARDGVRAVDAVGSGLASVWLHAAGATVAIHRGDTSAARRWVTDGRQVLATQVPLLGLDLLALAEARLAEADGDRGTARDLAVGALALFESMGMANCSRLLAPEVVRLADATGEREAAGQAREVLVAVAARTGLAIDVAQASLAEALEHRDPDRARQAVDAADSSPRPLHQAAIREGAAHVLWITGHRDEAARLLDEALRRYDDAGAAHDARRVRDTFTGFGLRRPRSKRIASTAVELTPREATIARLVALGRTNAEVGLHLGISSRTVETHLTRIYAKVGVRSRTQLAAELHRRTATT